MEEREFTVENNPMFFKLWDLKCAPSNEKENWYKYNIYATTTRDLNMRTWNGKHPVEENCTYHICKAGTKVLVWMVSRFGDVGVTDNLENPVGYDVRGLDADIDLTDYQFVYKKTI